MKGGGRRVKGGLPPWSQVQRTLHSLCVSLRVPAQLLHLPTTAA